MINVVGNAKSQFEKQNGLLIDMGTVIRFNWGGIVDPAVQGTRTDIVVTAEKHVPQCREIYPGALMMPTRELPFIEESRNYIAECDWTSSGFCVLYWLHKTGVKDVNLFGFDWDNTGVFYPHGWRGDRHNFPAEKLVISEWMEKNQWKLH